MRKKLIFFAVVLTAITLSAVHYQIPLTDGKLTVTAGRILMETLPNYTRLLLHLNGTEGSTTFTDDSSEAHAVDSTYGSPALNITIKKFGTASLSNSASYLVYNSNADWNFGDDSFTIDFWFYAASDSATRSVILSNEENKNFIFTIGPADATDWGSGGGYLGVHLGVYWVAQFAGASDICDGSWHHIAVTRDSADDKWRIYEDGQCVRTNVTDITLQQSYFNIGGRGTDRLLNHFVDEFRVSRGIVRWTDNFTPPSSEYSDD